jgi:hypothetical protein
MNISFSLGDGEMFHEAIEPHSSVYAAAKVTLKDLL